MATILTSVSKPLRLILLATILWNILKPILFFWDDHLYQIENGNFHPKRKWELPPYTSYTPSTFTDKYSSPFHFKSASLFDHPHTNFPLAICSQPSPPSPFPPTIPLLFFLSAGCRKSSCLLFSMHFKICSLDLWYFFFKQARMHKEIVKNLAVTPAACLGPYK